MLTRDEIARARTLTGLSFGKEQANANVYHSGMKPNAGWNASQLRGWLEEKLNLDLDSVCDTFSQAFFTLSEMEHSDPEKYKSFTENALYGNARSLSLQAEGLREELRYYRDQLEQASGVIAEMSRWLEEESSALFGSDQVRYSARIEEAARKIVEIRKSVVEKADGWTADIVKLQHPEGIGGPTVGKWMTNLLSGNSEPIFQSAPITRVSAANTRASRLMRASGLTDDQEATVTVYTDNEVVILLQAEVDGKLVAVDGATVTIRDILNPSSQEEEYAYDNGCVLVPINKLTADQFDVFHLEVKIDPTAQGYRDISFEDLDLERGAPYTCILAPLDSPANGLRAANPYVYMMSFNGKDIMQSEYDMIYSPANDYEFEIHVGVRNPSGETLPTLLMHYYKNKNVAGLEECWAEPTSQEGDVYVFKGTWKQLFSPNAEEGEQPTFMFGKDASASMTFPSQLRSIKGATDNPINEGTGPDGGVFANVLGKGLSMSFKIPVIDASVSLKLPLTQYLPKLCINPGGYVVIYVGSDMMQDNFSKLSWANWQSKDLKEYKRAQKFVEKEGAFANYQAQYGLAKDFYQEKRFKCLGETSLELGWFAVATGRWELDDSIPDILSTDVTLKLGTGMTLSLSVSWTISYSLGPVPAYIAITLGISAGFAMEFSLDLSYVNGEFKDWKLRPYSSFTIDIGILLAAQLGFGVKGFLEGFVKLAASMDLILRLSLQEPGSITITAALDLTVGVTVFFVTFSKSWNLAKKQLYPPESAGNLLAHYMNAGNDEPEAEEPAYGEPHSYPALAENAKEELCPNPNCVEYWAAGDYKVVRAGERTYTFYIGSANNPDGKKHKRLAWNLLDGDTNIQVCGSLQNVIDSDEAKEVVRIDANWIAAINDRDDYDFDVFGNGNFVYVVVTCAQNFDENGYPIPNDLTDGSNVKNMLVYVAVLEPNSDGRLTHLLSLTDSSGHNYVFGAASISFSTDMCERYDYDSFTSPRISYAGEKWLRRDGGDVFQNFELYGEMPRIAYPDQDLPTGATGFIYQGWTKFTLNTDKLVQNGMGDGYERTQILALDTGNYVNLPGRGSLSFVGLSRPKNGEEGDSAIELFNYYMNNEDNEDSRKAVVIETGAIDHLVLVEGLEWFDRDEAYSTVFYTKQEVNEDGAIQNRLYGLRIEPAEGNAHELHIEVKRFKYDVVTPVSNFGVSYINGVPYLYWIASAQKKDERDPDTWNIWALCYDEESNIMTSPSVLAQFKMPQISYWVEPPSILSPGITISLNGIIGNVMLTGTGTGYLNAIVEDIERIPERIRPDTPPASLFSFSEMLKPAASMIAAIPKELVVKAGSFDDFTMGVMNDGNVGISSLDLALYEVTDDGKENLVETAHIDASDPNNNSITMADGTVVQSGAAAGYRQEDYDNTSRKRDWVLDHDSTVYNIYVENTGITVDTEVLEPSDPYYIRTDVLMPGSVGGYTASFKIPDDWMGGTKTLRMKISSLSTFANWTRAMARAAGAPVTNASGGDDGELIELKYVLNNRTGKLELQKPANATGALSAALKSGLYANEIKGASVPVTVQVHDLEVNHRVYKGLGGERWLDISIRNHAATREGMKLVCAVYVDGAKEPSHYINLPYYENAALSHKTQTVSLPVSALVDDPSAHRTARVEILSVDRDERAYANNEFTVYLDGKDTVHFIQQPEDVIAQAGEDVSFSVEADGGKKPYRYQWQVWDKITRKWVDQPGFTGPTLSWKNVDKNRDGWKIRCVVTDAEGTKIISREATLHVWSDVPTGDSSNLPMYLTIAALALAAMVILWRKRRKV